MVPRMRKLINLLAETSPARRARLTAFMTQAGGTPVPAPKVAFPYNDTAGFLKLAQTFEDTWSTPTWPSPR